MIAATVTKTDLLDTFWQRHQRILRLQREYRDTLNDKGLRVLKRLRTSTFDDWCDVRRELSNA